MSALAEFLLEALFDGFFYRWPRAILWSLAGLAMILAIVIAQALLV